MIHSLSSCNGENCISCPSSLTECTFLVLGFYALAVSRSSVRPLLNVSWTVGLPVLWMVHCTVELYFFSSGRCVQTASWEFSGIGMILFYCLVNRGCACLRSMICHFNLLLWMWSTHQVGPLLLNLLRWSELIAEATCCTYQLTSSQLSTAVLPMPEFVEWFFLGSSFLHLCQGATFGNVYGVLKMTADRINPRQLWYLTFARKVALHQS